MLFIPPAEVQRLVESMLRYIDAVLEACSGRTPVLYFAFVCHPHDDNHTVGLQMSQKMC